MEIKRWDEEIRVIIIEIENQNKRLIEITNNLMLHSNENSNSELINETLTELLKFKRGLFQIEEVMKRYNYPGIDKHKKIHKQFGFRIAMFCNDVVDRKTRVTEELIKFLLDWQILHISVCGYGYNIYS